MKKRRNSRYILGAALCGLVLLAVGGCANSSSHPVTNNQSISDDTKIEWKDKALESLIREYLNKPSGTIYAADVSGIKYLHIEGTEIQYPEESDPDFTSRINQKKESDTQEKRLVYSIDDLLYFKNLTQLVITKGRFEDINVLSSLPDLSVLKLESCPISNITPLSKLTKLTEVSFAEDLKTLDSLKPLTASPDIKSLNLNKCVIAASDPLNPLVSLTKLSRLDLSSCKLKDLTSLEKLVHVQELNLSDTVSDGNLAFLEKLPQLTTLSLAGNSITKLDALTHMPNLTSLTVSYTRVSNLTPLSGLTELNYLDLSHNQIRDVHPLANLSKLNTLILDNNTIWDFSPLEKFTSPSLTIHAAENPSQPE